MRDGEQSGYSFGSVLESLKQGDVAWRKGWNGKDIYIELQVPDAHSKMTQPYIFINTKSLDSENPNAPRGLVPWLASQTDMLASDWVIATKENYTKGEAHA